MFLRTITAAALVFAATAVSAADFVPGSEMTVQGTVSGFESARTFWLDVDGDRVLVYGTSAQRARLYPGQKVRVQGSISDDFIKLAKVELQARRIESVRTEVSVSTAAMQTP